MGICFSYEEERDDNKFMDLWKEYNDKYDLSKINNDDNEEKKDLSTFFIIEYVPLYGNVIMSYNNNENAFTYYCDKSIPSSYLETVSRKYILTCNYKNIYHIEKQEEEETKERKNKKELPSVYGNIKKKKNIISNNNDKINKFINLGKIQNYNIINNNKKEIQKKKLSYSDYILSKNT